MRHRRTLRQATAIAEELDVLCAGGSKKRAKRRRILARGSGGRLQQSEDEGERGACGRALTAAGASSRTGSDRCGHGFPGVDHGGLGLYCVPSVLFRLVRIMEWRLQSRY